MVPFPTALSFRLSCHLHRPVPHIRCHHDSILRVSHKHPFTRSLQHRYHRIEGMRRQIYGNNVDKGKHSASEHRSDHAQPTPHSHSHGTFGGHSHLHGHGDHDHAHGGGLIETLEKGGAGPRFYTQLSIHSIQPCPPSPIIFRLRRRSRQPRDAHRTRRKHPPYKCEGRSGVVHEFGGFAR
jgi:hypothetical protein